MYHIFIIHSSVDGHLGCFQFLPAMNRGRGLQENSTQQDWHAQEFTETVAACKRPEQVQTRQNPNSENGTWTQSPILTKEQFAIDNC